MADLTRSQLVSGTQGIFAKNESDACPGLDPTRSAAPVRKCPRVPESARIGDFASGVNFISACVVSRIGHVN